MSFGSKVRVRPRTFGCVAMGTASSCMFRSRLLVYYAGSGVNRVEIVLSGFSMKLCWFVQAKTLCRYGCIYLLVERRDMGLYEVSLSVSLLGLGIGAILDNCHV